MGQSDKWSTMKLLPKEDWRMEMMDDGIHVIVSIYEHPKGCRRYDKLCLSDLPNDLISLDDLESEFKTEEMGAVKDKCLAIFHRERECDPFTGWEPGSSPKEHREMMDRKWLLKWQVEREDADKKWREQQDIDNRRWQSSQNVKMAIAAGLFTVTGAVLGATLSLLAKG